VLSAVILVQGEESLTRTRIGIAVLLLFSVVDIAARQGPLAVDREHQQLAREILQELIALKTTESGLGATPAAEAVARRLRAAGFADTDVQVLGPSERKKNLVARLRGAAAANVTKPILLLAHLDVVEARAEDWSAGLDPFTLTERDGYFYGRGTQDIKDGAAILTANFIRWRREGWIPRRDIVLALTADEERPDLENGVQWLLQHRRHLIDAEYAINTDSGDFQSRNGQPYVVSLAAAEKTAANLQLEVTNPGGHGSLPRRDNAIYQLAAALERIRNFRFPPVLIDVTRQQFAATATLQSGQVAADMRALARTTDTQDAIARLSQDPYWNALLRTTCVPTEINGGHAPNALPQRVIATLNCRLLPGHPATEVIASIKAVVGDPEINVSWNFLETTEYPASPLRDDILSSMRRVAQQLWPTAVVVPVLETGGTDGRFLRGASISTYGASGVFIDEGDYRAHGRDERIRVRDFYQGVEFYGRFIRALGSQP
jgi:acetylornithine deacetylase/succinyl-diaminopimelate desuccinylase-like protein